MIREAVATLIAEVPEAHGVYETPAPAERDVFCQVQSVHRAEAYEALSHGLHPEWVLVLADYAEYAGEHRCRFEGQEYRILRTYVRPDYSIELTIERVVNQ